MAVFKAFVILLCMFALTPSFSMATFCPNNIFILGGQSNMAGRGGVYKNSTGHGVWDGIIPLASRSQKSILRFTAGSKWEQAHEPLHWDIDYNKTNGVGPGMAFANELLALSGKSVGVVGLVPCAIGGTHIREWIKGTENYTRLVNRINASQKSGGKLRAFFWYQGESDASVKEDAKFYERNLTKFFTDLRKDLNRPDLPIVLVKIATQDTLVSPVINYTEEVRRAQMTVRQKLTNIRTVDAMNVVSLFKVGLNGDNCHLNRKSAVETGKMMAYTFLKYFGRGMIHGRNLP